jgi:hypothetical protein
MARQLDPQLGSVLVHDETLWQRAFAYLCVLWLMNLGHHPELIDKGTRYT